MPTPKLNPSRSIAVIPSDYCNIPNPALLITECVSTSSGLGNFNVYNTNLVEAGVKVGDIVYDYTNMVAATITSIQYIYNPMIDPSMTNIIVLSGPITISTETPILIYNGQDDSTGCVLYVGNGGSIRVITEGGDDVILQGVLTGSFMPVQVTKIFLTDTAAVNILALR